jgi:rhodanese-related sulfurtransferase/DNA-binding winged helix-turn-helix (wHTH) protein
MQDESSRETRSSAASIEAVLRAAQERLDRLTPRQAAREQVAGALIVDIRSEADRRADGEIPGSLILERNVLEWRLDPTSSWRIAEAVDHALRAIIVCPEGYVSSLAAVGLRDIGLYRATDVIGGFHGWRGAGCPVVRSVTMAGSYVAAAPAALTLDAVRQQLLVDGVPITLTRLEFRLLDELLRANGRVVTRDELRGSIGDWPGSRSRSVDLHIHRIRRKLGPRAAALLTTEWGVGFRLRAARERALSGVGDDDDVEVAGSVDAFDAIEFDVAGGGGPGDPGLWAGGVEAG